MGALGLELRGHAALGDAIEDVGILKALEGLHRDEDALS